MNSEGWLEYTYVLFIGITLFYGMGSTNPDREGYQPAHECTNETIGTKLEFVPVIDPKRQTMGTSLSLLADRQSVPGYPLGMTGWAELYHYTQAVTLNPDDGS